MYYSSWGQAVSSKIVYSKQVFSQFSISSKIFARKIFARQQMLEKQLHFYWELDISHFLITKACIRAFIYRAFLIRAFLFEKCSKNIAYLRKKSHFLITKICIRVNIFELFFIICSTKKELENIYSNTNFHYKKM